ncbi:hypothetical protein USB125703_00767 [Pseudoclavibacter triregionum]|nr:hypothetical protein USB125703_00767 [Pseudoclavibacter triregionum]
MKAAGRSIEPSLHPSADPIEALEAAERLVAYATSARSLVLATLQERALARSEGLGGKAQEHEVRATTAEAALAIRRSERTTAKAMATAHALVTRFPTAHGAWARGEIGEQHAEIVVRYGHAIECEERRGIYEAAVVEAAKELSPGRLVPVARSLAEEARELPLDERHRTAAEERRVWVDDAGDGMSFLTAYLPTVLAHAIRDRLVEHAKALSEPPAGTGTHGCDAERAAADETIAGCPSDGPDDGSEARPTAADGDANGAESPAGIPVDRRSFAAKMADCLADLLLTSDAAQIVQRADRGAPRIDARVSITVPALALLDGEGGVRDAAELLGVGPVPMETARTLASEAPSLARILTDPVREVPVAVDRYVPSAAMRTTLAVRDRRCRFPGCRRPADRCDLDHTIDAVKGGPTAMGNLAHLCRWHHTLKHQSKWSVRQLDDGLLEWTSPAGRVYADRPDAAGPRFKPPDPPGSERPPGGPAPGKPSTGRDGAETEPSPPAGSDRRARTSSSTADPPPF